MTEKQKAFLEDFDSELGIDMHYEMQECEKLSETPQDIDEFMERAEELINQIECIYYHNAMEYLTQNDTSLQESLGLAHDMGYTADNINSELLATLLMQQNAREQLYEYRDEIEELFYSDNNE